jgi:hypothetical protein
MSCDTGMVRMPWGGMHGLYSVHAALSSEKPQPPRGAACAPVAVCTRAASSVRTASAVRSKTLWRLYLCEALLEGLAQHLQDVASALREFIEKEHAMVRQRHVARHRHLPPPIRPTSEIVCWGPRHGRVVTTAVRAPVRPATRWMRVV